MDAWAGRKVSTEARCLLDLCRPSATFCLLTVRDRHIAYAKYSCSGLTSRLPAFNAAIASATAAAPDSVV